MILMRLFDHKGNEANWKGYKPEPVHFTRLHRDPDSYTMHATFATQENKVVDAITEYRLEGKINGNGPLTAGDRTYITENGTLTVSLDI